MSRRSAAALRSIRAWLKNSKPMTKAAKVANRALTQIHHGLANIAPALISPTPRQLTIAVTAFCNLRCIGCNYGRDFMKGEQLSWVALKGALDDAKWAGIEKVRFYGGEPLLHPRIVDAVAYARTIGLEPYITTNGLLLRQKIDALYAAGLRLVTIGFYGEEEHYDSYTQRAGRFRLLDESLTYVRENYGSYLELQLNYVLLKPTGSVTAVDEAWEFARRFNMHLHVDLANNSAPFFNTGGSPLSFDETDRIP
jgi:molybdenum cofactor biosynthesis enzyme MoaA